MVTGEQLDALNTNLLNAAQRIVARTASAAAAMATHELSSGSRNNN